METQEMNVDLVNCRKTEIYCFGEIVNDTEIILNVNPQITKTRTGLKNKEPKEYTHENIYIHRDEETGIINMNHLLHLDYTEVDDDFTSYDSWTIKPSESGTDFNFVKIQESANLLIISWQTLNEDGIEKGQTIKICFPFHRVQSIRTNTYVE
jgi:hypothetical protein